MKKETKVSKSINIRETIIEKIMNCGYGMFEACEEADRIIKEFKASGKKQANYGIMGSFGKCVDTITLARK